MKKLLMTLTLIFALCLSAFTLTACSGDNNDGGETPPPHNHSYISKFNSSSHWHECECGDKIKIEEHNPGAEATETTDQVCMVCDYVLVPALNHVHNSQLTKVEAKEQSCTKEGNIEYYQCSCNKLFTDNTATTEITDIQSVIIEKDAHNHTILKKTTLEHWYECKCGDKGEKENHKGGTSTCTKLAECSVCATEYGEYAEHTYDIEYTYDETHHYNQPTCGCNVKEKSAEHCTDDSGFCIECDKPIDYTKGIIYEYSGDRTYIEVVGYEGVSTKINIAPTYNNLPVKSIYNKTFFKTNITKIIIPASVTSIADSVFKGCGSLQSITFEGNSQLTSIGSYAFSSCKSLTSIVIPDSVTSIGDYAFQSCTSLEKIEIPNNVTSIGYAAFSICNSLERITVAGANTIYHSKDNCLIETATNTLILGCKNSIIPNYVTSIGLYAFFGCSSLTSIVIPASVTTIGNAAFLYCNLLTSIVIPDSVTSIGHQAFDDCTSLTSITFGENSQLISIGSYAFSGCDSLTSIKIPDSVTSIDVGAFYGCSSLESVTFGANSQLTSIGSSAFRYCEKLTSIEIPDSVTSIDTDAFSNCKSLTSIVIPDSVKGIRAGAFEDCNSLTSVYYSGTAEDWYVIDIGVNNNSLTNATRYYYVENESDLPARGNYWHYVDGVPTVWIKNN